MSGESTQRYSRNHVERRQIEVTPLLAWKKPPLAASDRLTAGRERVRQPPIPALLIVGQDRSALGKPDLPPLRRRRRRRWRCKPSLYRLRLNIARRRRA
ncbi:hypothetical protein MTO96_011394 [Rhipicephalus appendiculatus]